MTQDVAKAINELSKRINEVESKLEKFLLDRHDENKSNIDNVDGAVQELAEVISELSTLNGGE